MKKPSPKKTYKKSKSFLKTKIVWLGAVIAILLGVSTYTALTNGSGPLANFFQPASINKLIIEDPNQAKTAAEKKAIEKLNLAATNEARNPTAANQKKTEAAYADLAKTVKTGNTSTGTNTPKCYGNLQLVGGKCTDSGNHVSVDPTCPTGTTLQGTQCLPPPPTTTTGGGNNNASSSGGSFCEGGSKGVKIPHGTWAASGRGWEGGAYSKKEGTVQRECMQCLSGKWVGSKACNEQYKEDPSSVILPPGAGTEYTAGEKQGTIKDGAKCTKINGVESCGDSSYKENCYEGSGLISATGVVRGNGDRCFDGNWLSDTPTKPGELSEFDSRMKDTCINAQYNAVTNKCGTPPPPGEAPAVDPNAGRCGNGFTYRNGFCDLNTTSESGRAAILTAGKQKCLAEGKSDYDTNTGLCQAQTIGRPFECKSGATNSPDGRGYVICGNGATNSPSATYKWCDVGSYYSLATSKCETIKVPLAKEIVKVYPQSSDCAASCKGTGYSCLAQSGTKVYACVKDAAPGSVQAPEDNPDVQKRLDEMEAKIKASGKCTETNIDLGIRITCNPTTKEPTFVFCDGGKGRFDSSGKCTPANLPAPVPNVAPEKCDSTGAKQCSIVCGGLNTYTCDSGGGNCTCNNAGEVIPPANSNTSQTQQPGSIKKGYWCRSDNAACETGYCAPGTLRTLGFSTCEEKPSGRSGPDITKVTKENGIVGAYAIDPSDCKYGNGAIKNAALNRWICPTDSLAIPNLAPPPDTSKNGTVKEGYWCEGNDDLCETGYCARGSLGTFGFSVCEKNPARNPNPTNLDLYKEILRHNPDAFDEGPGDFGHYHTKLYCEQNKLECIDTGDGMFYRYVDINIIKDKAESIR